MKIPFVEKVKLLAECGGGGNTIFFRKTFLKKTSERLGQHAWNGKYNSSS